MTDAEYKAEADALRSKMPQQESPAELDAYFSERDARLARARVLFGPLAFKSQRQRQIEAGDDLPF